MPEVRRHTARGRRPWYTLEVAGRYHHLGIDQGRAYARAAELLSAAGVERPTPQVVGGLIRDYGREHPSSLPYLNRWLDAQGAMPLSDVTTQTLQDWIDGMVEFGRAPNYVRTIWGKVCSALRWAKRKGLLGAIDSPRLPAAQQQARDLDPQAIEGLFSRLQSQTRAILLFVFLTGCRPGEAARLEWSMIRDGSRTIVLPKHKTGKATGRPKTLYLSPAAIELLRLTPRRGTHVFLTRFGKPFTAHGLSDVMRYHGIHGAYTLRHTFAQIASEQMLPQNLARLMGHSRITTTQWYYTVRDARASEAIDRLALPVPPLQRTLVRPRKRKRSVAGDQTTSP